MSGYKTIFVALATIVIGLLEQYDITKIIPDTYDELALSVVGAIMIALRLVTKTPVGK